MTEKKGLKIEHLHELNNSPDLFPGGAKAKKERIIELRNVYSDNSMALQQLDIFYPGPTEHSINLAKLVEALKSNNEKEVALLKEWFEKNYPDT